MKIVTRTYEFVTKAQFNPRGPQKKIFENVRVNLSGVP